MKRIICFFLVFAVGLHLDGFSETISLQKALDQKKLSVKVVALGGHQGNCAEISIQNLGQSDLSVEIEAGRRLNSLNDNEQDLLIVRTYTVDMRGLERKTIAVKAYCCQAEKMSPSKKSLYDVNRVADLPLYLLARYLNANCFDADVEQKAVWAISNQRSAATITGHSDSLIKQLREFVAGIKGEKLPWYTLLTRTYTSTEGSIHSHAMELRGDLLYSTDRNCYMTLQIFDEAGMPVCMVKCEWLKPVVGGRYPLTVPVRHLARGRYRVEMQSGGTVLASETFTI